MSEYVTSLVSLKEQKERAAKGEVVKRFRYQSFTDRVSKVNVDVFHKIRKVELAPQVETAGMKRSTADSAELFASFFVQRIPTLSASDKSAEFSAFLRDIRKYSISLPLLLHFREKIMAAFVKHLQVPSKLALASLTDLLPHLARDLRHEFFPYFGRILDALVNSIDEKNPEIMEQIFSCIAYLFKFLIRSMVDNQETLFTHHYVHLLSHKKPFIRNFAAETLPFVIRRVHPSLMSKTLAMFMAYPAYLQMHVEELVTKEDNEDSEDEDVKRVAQRVKQDGLQSVVESFRQKTHFVFEVSANVRALVWDEERITCMVDGIGKLLHHLCRGVQGSVHSTCNDTQKLVMKLASVHSDLVVDKSFKYTKADVPTMRRNQLEFRGRVLNSFVHDLTSYLKAENTEPLSAALIARAQLVLVRIHDALKVSGVLRVSGRGDVSEDSSDDSSVDSEDERKMGDMELYNANETKILLNDKTLVHLRGTSNTIATEDLMRELIHIIAAFEEYVHLRGTNSYATVTDFITDLTAISFLRALGDDEVSQLLMFHTINLYLLTIGVCNDFLSPKSTRVITDDKRSEMEQAVEVLQLILRDLFTLPKHYFLFTYMINVLRVYMSSQDVADTVLPVLIESVVQPSMQNKAQSLDERNEVLHMLYCLTRPIPKHILSSYPRVKPLQLTFSMQDLVREVPHLQAQYTVAALVPQHMKPTFYKQFAASLEVQEQLMGVYDVDINYNQFAHVIMNAVPLKNRTVLVNYLASVVLECATAINSGSEMGSTLVDARCALHILLGMFVSPYTVIDVVSKKKTKKTTLYSVFYTTHHSVAARMALLLQGQHSPDAAQTVAELSHMLYTLETVCICTGYARLAEDIQFEGLELELLMNVKECTYEQGISADILTVIPKAKTNSVSGFVGTMFKSMMRMLSTLNTYQQHGFLRRETNDELFAMFNSTLQRLCMFIQEVVRHVPTSEQNEVQRLLQRSDAWAPEKSVMNTEVVDITRKSSLLEEDNLIEDGIMAEEHMRYLKRSKKLWKEYQKSLLPANEQPDKHMRDRPKVDKATFLSEVERLKLEKKERLNQEHEDNITRIFVSQDMTHKERRNIIGDVLKRLRQDRLQARRDQNNKETELELDLKQRYLEANIASPFLESMRAWQQALFPGNERVLTPSAFQLALTRAVLPYLSSPITSIRCLAVTVLASFPELPMLASPVTTQQEQEGSLHTSLDIAQLDGRDGDVMSMIYMISCLPIDISTNRSVLKRFDSLQAYANSGVLSFYHVHVLVPFLVSVLSMRMTNYFAPAKQVLEALLLRYPTHTWPYVRAFLFDSLLHMHTIADIVAHPALYGGIMPSEPSHDLMTTRTEQISTVSICNGTYHNKNLLSYLQRRQYDQDLYVDLTSGIKESSMKELFSVLTMDNCKAVVTKKIDDLFDMFIFFMRTEFTLFYPLVETSTWKYDKYSGNISFMAQDRTQVVPTCKTHSSSKLLLFLRIFTSNVSKLHTYKYANSVLVPQATRLLSFTDNAMQSAAFSLLLKLKLPYVLPYAKLLERMFDFKDLRSALTTLTTSVYSSTRMDSELLADSTVTPIMPDHRAHLAPLLYYMFMRSLHDTKAKGSYSYRTGIISVLSVVPVQELVTFFTLVFRPFMHTMLYGSNNVEYSLKIAQLEEVHLQNVLLPFDVQSFVDIDEQNTLMSAAMQNYSSNPVYHDACTRFSTSITHECALDSIVSHLLIANNKHLLMHQPHKSSLDHFISTFGKAVKHDLRDSFPLLLNNTQFALQEYFQVPIRFESTNLSSLDVLSSKRILPYVEVTLQRQEFFLSMLQDVVLKLRTSAVPYLPSIMYIVCYLLQRTDVRLKQYYESKNSTTTTSTISTTTVVKKFILNRVSTTNVEEMEEEYSSDEEEKKENDDHQEETTKHTEESMTDSDSVDNVDDKNTVQQLRSIRRMCLKFVADMVDFYWEPFGLRVEEIAPEKTVVAKKEWFRTSEPADMRLRFAKKEELCVQVLPAVLYESLHAVLLSSRDSIRLLPQEGVYSRGSLLEVVCSIARHRALQPIFALPEHEDILPTVFEMLHRPDINQQAASAVLEIALHLINTLTQIRKEKIEVDDEDIRMIDDEEGNVEDEDEDASGSDDEDEEVAQLSELSEEEEDAEDEYLSDDDDSGLLSERRRAKHEKVRQERDLTRLNSLKFDLSHKEVTPEEPGVVSPALETVLAKLLENYTPVLLHGLSLRMQVLTGVYGREGDLSTQKKKNGIKKHLPKREFFIASFLSEYISDAETAQNLINMLVLYLPEDQPRPPYSLDVSALGDSTKIVVNIDLRAQEVLKIFVHAVRVLKDVDFLIELYHAMAWELVLVFDLEARKLLVDVIVEIQKQVTLLDSNRSAEVVPEEFVSMMQDMVALEYNRKQLVTDVDFEKRANAYTLLRAQNEDELLKRREGVNSRFIDDSAEIIQPTLTVLPTLEEMSAEVKVDHAVVEIELDAVCEVSDRYYRRFGGAQLAPFVAIAINELYSKEFPVREQAISALTDFIYNNVGCIELDSDSPSTLVNQIHSHVLRNLSNLKFHIVRKYHLLVLRALGQRFPGRYPSYFKMTSTIADNDFFLNIMHIQPFRRTLALRNVVNFVREEIKQDENLNFVKDANTPQFKSVHATSVNSVLLPLIFAFLNEVSASVLFDSMKAARVKKFTKRNVSAANDAGVDHALLEECIRGCSVFVQLLPWKTYAYRIMQMFKNVTSKKNQNKFFLRAACVAIEAFPFRLGMNSSILAHTAAGFTDIIRNQLIQQDVDASSGKKKTGAQHENVADIMGLHSDLRDDTYSAYIDAFESTDNKVADAAMKKLLKNKNMSRELVEKLTAQKQEMQEDTASITSGMRMIIRKQISSKILPNMFKFATDLKMEENSTKAQAQAQTAVSKNIGSLRVGVVMALVHLLQKVSVVDFHIQFPRLLRVVCTQLGRKELEFRVSARKTLVEILQSVGPEFFMYILRELKSSLTNGYQLHVLGNSLFVCLNTYIKDMKVPVGSLDHCLPVLLPMLREDLLGAHVEEKGVELLCSRYPEMKSMTTPGSFELLGMSIDFNNSVPAVTGILAKELSMSTDRKQPEVTTVHRITHCLHKIVRGLNLNTSVKQDALLAFVLDLMKACTGVSTEDARKEEDSSESESSDDDSDDSDDSDVAWYSKLEDKGEKKKKQVVYTGELKNNHSSKSRVVGGYTVGGSVVNAKRVTDDERLAIHPSLGGTTHRSKEAASRVREVVKTVDMNLGKDFLVSIHKSGQSNYQGGSTLLLYSLQQLSSALNPRKYANIARILNIRKGENIGAEDQHILAILANLPRLLNMSIFQIDRGHKDARKELGNTCGGKGADMLKGELKKFQARTEQVLNSALRIMCILLRLPLTSWVYKKGKFLYGITNFQLNMLASTGNTNTKKSIAQGSGNSIIERFSSTGSANIRNVCFKVLSYGLKYNQDFALNDKQLDIIQPIINYEVHDKVIRNISVFEVLYALLEKKVMKPEIYDIAAYCSELLQRSNENNVRNHASNVFFFYLLSYPLAAKRQEQHLSFIINNLNYEIPGSRLILIKLLQHVVARFPFAYIEKYAELMFFPLCLSLYNDTDAACKERLTSVVGSLFNRLNGASALFMARKDHIQQLETHKEALTSKRNTLLSSIFMWIESKQPAQIRMACLILGAITPYIGDLLNDYCDRLVGVLGKLVKGGAMVMLKQSQEMTQAIIHAKRTLRGYDESDEKYNEEDDTNESISNSQSSIFKQLMASQQDMEAEVKLSINSCTTGVEESFNEEEENEEELINIDNDVDKMFDEENNRMVIEEVQEDEDEDEGHVEEQEEDDMVMDGGANDDDDVSEEESKNTSSSSSTKSVVTRGVTSSLDQVQDEELFRVSAAAQGSWYVTYTALCCLEKVWRVCPESMLAAVRKHGVWTDVLQLCQHPHNWVRLACARMLYTHFQQCDIRQCGSEDYVREQTAIGSMEALLDTAKTVALQTNSTFMDEAMSKFTVHNLSFVTLALYMASEHPFFSDYNARVRAKMAENTNEHTQLELSLTEDFINGAMHWVISNVGFLARKTNNIMVSLTVFKFFQELVDTLPAQHLRPFQLTFVDPLYRIIEDPRKVAKAYKILGSGNFMQKNVDKLKASANDTSEKIKKKCGSDIFVQVYHSIHRKLTEVRSDRKRKMTEFATSDPVAFKEMKRQKLLKDAKKRKQVKNYALAFKK